MSYTILKEKTVLLSDFLETPSRYLGGVTRVVDSKARSIGLFVHEKAMENLLENLEASTPQFRAKLEKSRKSGKVSATHIRKRLDL